MIKIHPLLLFFFLILPVGAEKKPNFLFIIVDDQSPLDLKIYNPRSILDTPQYRPIGRGGNSPGWSPSYGSVGRWSLYAFPAYGDVRPNGVACSG